ncbi:MAG: hypothetical protein GXP42_09605, partial [Chloroflexi bacterium]|nr:hypothetical protein [Chloroflexota bacterium]
MSTSATRFDLEMQRAQAARAEGNEGRARVCARRAAGVVANEYLMRQGVNTPGMTAMERLKLLQTWPDLPPETRDIIAHMLMRVDRDYSLPPDIDLVAEAQKLAEL